MRTRNVLVCLALAAALASCSAGDGDPSGDPNGATAHVPRQLGAQFDDAGTSIRFRVASATATRIEVWLYDQPTGAPERAHVALARAAGSRDLWEAVVPASMLRDAGIGDTVYYGYRAWGPNWTFDPAWTPGSHAGFVADVDAHGNRFNPNKLLFDPYARELSHDPVNPANQDGAVFASGEASRDRDTAPVAPKSIVLAPAAASDDLGAHPQRPLRDEVIYEVHVRGLTMNDPSIPMEQRGTYLAAGQKAEYLRALGVTAVEFLPVQETQNDQNDIDPRSTDGDNYWGYATLAYFAPDRRYAFDRSPGGPTREFRAMVGAFHAAGIKVYLDVVYNHTAEGGLWDGTGDRATLYSLRGLDNTGYYEVTGGGRFYFDSNGVGANVNTAAPLARDLIVDSLRYWSHDMGVDGFRFDLGAVLGNRCADSCFQFDKFDPDNALNRAVHELPARPADGGAGVDLIAEPWAIGDGTYQLGNFPAGWAEWNGRYRDTIRRHQNRLGSDDTTPGQLATRIAGSSDLYGDDGRRPWHSINFLVAHDGFTLRDLYSYNGKNNNQPWPFGPSDGGEDNNNSWDSGNDRALQQRAARNGLALLMTSAGVPMITGGDEFYRTQRGNNNAYNLDAPGNWLDWSDLTTHAAFHTYAQRLIAFRNAHPAMRPADFFAGRDRNGNGLRDITWYSDRAQADDEYLADSRNRFLAWRFDGTEAGDSAASIYVAYNGWSGDVTATLPANLPGMRWFRVVDTADRMESDGNARDAGAEDELTDATYGLQSRSVVILIER